MTKKTRYSLLALGFLIFLILAPLLVMYVRGVSFDFDSQNFVETGLIAIRTEPKKADIYLNNILTKDTSGDLTFLTPDEYNVTIKKEGYFDWEKRLTVKPSQVTWANPAPNKIYLFLKNQTPDSIAAPAQDFVLLPDSFAYISNNTLVIAPQKDPAAITNNFPLPKPADTILKAPGNNHLILTNKNLSAASGKEPVLFFNTGSRTFTDLSPLFTGHPAIKFTADGAIYALEQENLYRVDPFKKTKTLILQKVKDFTFTDNTLYYLSAGKTAWTLATSDFNGQNRQEIIIDNFPAFAKAELLVTRTKQIFLVADQALYKVNLSLEKLSDGVIDWQFNQDSPTLIFAHNGEVSNYNFSNNRIDFVTRSGQNIKNLFLRQSVSYVFLSKDNKIIGIELDTRDRQNEYVFYEGSDIQKFFIDDDTKNITVLDNGELKTVKIR